MLGPLGKARGKKKLKKNKNSNQVNEIKIGIKMQTRKSFQDFLTKQTTPINSGSIK